MTSIEWLIEEMLNKGFFKESVTLTNIDHLQYKAEEMYNKEVEISDEEIEKESWKYCYENKISSTNIVHWITACKWYREQLKQPKKD